MTISKKRENEQKTQKKQAHKMKQISNKTKIETEEENTKQEKRKGYKPTEPNEVLWESNLETGARKRNTGQCKLNPAAILTGKTKKQTKGSKLQSERKGRERKH